MTRLEKLMSSIVGGILIISISIVLIVSIKLCSNFNESNYANMADIGVNVFKNDLIMQVENLKDISTAFKLDGDFDDFIVQNNTEAIANIYAQTDANGFDFCLVTDNKGKRLWVSDSFKLASYDVSQALEGNEVSGYYSDPNVNFCCIYQTPIYNEDLQLVGVCMLGNDLSAHEFIDNTKTQTLCDVTLFAGDTRYNTTVKNDDGSRVVGTQMSEAVKAKVIDGGEIYRGKANIIGHRYFVTYEPLTDINGNIIGAAFAGQPTTKSDKVFRSVILMCVLITIAIMIASFIGIAYITRRTIAKPIVLIGELADHMSSGELNIPDFEHKFDKNEMGDLATKLQGTKHSLSYMVNDISDVLTKMSGGDFTAQPQIEYYGDFSSIEESFKTIRTSLSEIVSNITISSEQVLIGSKQMADGTQILADGATTQATAVTELNEKISDISKKISGNAQNAIYARDLSAKVQNDAIAQSEDMNELVQSMHDIELKSNDVIEIIKTIDDIAFQTNILALNAAVEAAKAGEAGRGFAVVADEVRALASESADAAENTTDLITAMVSAIKAGSARVLAVSESMQEITAHAKESNRLMDEISAASEQQADSVREINEGISQISDVVQQNSATAEQTAASCQQLSGQSNMLKEQITRLKA